MKFINFILFVVLLTGCTGNNNSPVIASKPSVPLDELTQSTVYLGGDSVSASGVLIGYHKATGHRIGLTCYHFWEKVNKPENEWVLSWEKKNNVRCHIPFIFDPNKNEIVTMRSEAIHLEWDELTDLSLFMLASVEPFYWQEVNIDKTQLKDEEVIKVGFPRGLFKRFEGKVEYFTTEHSIFGHYTINIPVQPGDSGSPLFRKSDNKIVGIVSQMVDGKGMAIPNAVIQKFVEKYCDKDKYVITKHSAGQTFPP